MNNKRSKSYNKKNKQQTHHKRDNIEDDSVNNVTTEEKDRSYVYFEDIDKEKNNELNILPKNKRTRSKSTEILTKGVNILDTKTNGNQIQSEIIPQFSKIILRSSSDTEPKRDGSADIQSNHQNAFENLYNNEMNSQLNLKGLR